MEDSVSRTVPASEKIVIGMIGCGGMGMAGMNFFVANPDVEVAAVCDVYEPHLQHAVEKTEGKAAPYKDFRKLLERKDLDAVVISTPDHWHAIHAIQACQAGKDVYVEKPLTYSIAEGRAVVNAARTNKRVVQVGTQQRSGAHFRRAVEIVQSGKIGKVAVVKCWKLSNSAPDGIGNPPDCDPPDGLDWNMWLGPAPMRPYNPNRCIYNFRVFWDYAGGMLTNWGTHLIDTVHWVMSVDAPLAAAVSGGKYVLKDNSETPDTIEAVFEYPGFVLVFSYRNFNAHPPGASRDHCMEFYGSDGTLILDRDGFRIYPEGERMRDADVELESGGSKQYEPHVRNFLDCIKSREMPVSDVEIGHRSSSAPTLGNISLKVGRKIYWDREKEQIIGDDEASKLLSRPYRKPWSL